MFGRGALLYLIVEDAACACLFGIRASCCNNSSTSCISLSILKLSLSASGSSRRLSVDAFSALRGPILLAVLATSTTSFWWLVEGEVLRLANGPLPLNELMENGLESSLLSLLCSVGVAMDQTECSTLDGKASAP